MGQFIFTFYSTVSKSETVDIIKNVVTHIGGKIKVDQNNTLVAKWRSKKFITVFPTKCMFYVGTDMIRAIIPAPAGFGGGLICMDRGSGSPYEKIWNEFLLGLDKLYPDMDFGLKSGNAILESAKFIGEKTEQIFSSTSRSRPSLTGALLGGILFGTPGAIIGGIGKSSSNTHGKSITRSTNEIITTVRYTNGLTFTGEIVKDSYVYNQIIVNMSELNKD